MLKWQDDKVLEEGMVDVHESDLITLPAKNPHKKFICGGSWTW
jgi:hypothetical protein